jgi:hypothetical protein
MNMQNYFVLDFVTFVVWTVAFAYNLATNNISRLDYVLMYLAFICETLLLFVARCENKKNK